MPISKFWPLKGLCRKEPLPKHIENKLQEIIRVIVYKQIEIASVYICKFTTYFNTTSEMSFNLIKVIADFDSCQNGIIIKRGYLLFRFKTP